MDVGSVFAIYGNLFGWYSNNLITNFIINTGLWFIPYFFILYSTTFGSREEGESFNAVSILVKLEVKIYLSLFVIALFLNPTVDVSKVTFQHSNSGVVLNAGSSGTNFSAMADTITNPVELPPAWYAISVFTNSFNQVFKTVLPTAETARELMHQVSQVKLSDQAVQGEYNKFVQYCYKPATSNYLQVMSVPTSQLAQTITTQLNTLKADKSTPWKYNPKYAGNLILQRHFYRGDNNCPESDPNGMASACVHRGSADLQHYQSEKAWDNCLQWWTGTVVSDGIRENVTDSLNDEANGVLNGTWFDNDDNLAAALQKNQQDSLNNAVGINNKEGNGALMQWVAETFTGFTGKVSNAFVEFTTTIIRFALPLLLGVITMFIIVMMPILILFSRYSVDRAVSLSITFFGLLMLAAIWHFIAWLDQVILYAIWGNGSVVSGNGFGIGRVAWDLVVLSSYFFLSRLWLGLVSDMGGSVSHAIGSGLNAASSTAGTIAGGRMARGAGKVGAQKAGNAVYNRFMAKNSK